MRVLVVLGTSAGGVGQPRARPRRVADRGGPPRRRRLPARRSTPTSRCTRSPPPWCRSSLRPPAPGARRAGRARPGRAGGRRRRGARPRAAGGAPWRCWPSVRAPVPVVATLHNAAPAGALTGAVYAGLERVVALRSPLVLGVSADLVERMRAARRPPHRAGRGGRAAAHATATARPVRRARRPRRRRAAPRSPSSWPGSPRRRGSTCCSTRSRAGAATTARPGDGRGG